MKNLLLLLLFPIALHAQVYQIYPGEYDMWARNPKTKLISDVVASNNPVAGFPMIADGDGKGSAALHTAGFIGTDGIVYVEGDNACNISGLGLKAASLGATKTAVGNARQIVNYANSGDGSGQGLGYGFAVVTNDDKLILMGNTQSGFRGDGTEGNMAEPAPYQVTAISKPVLKVAIGSFVYVLYYDGTVDSWGGTRLQYYPTYVLGRGVNNPDPTRPGAMKFPEPIVDVQGGGNWTLFIGQSGAIYGVAYNTRYLGLGPNVQGQNTAFNLTKTLGLPGIPAQLAVGTQASYARMTNGDVYSWGDNTQAAIGNGQEATFSNFTAPWGGGALWVDKPVKINPAGVSFVKIFAGIGDAFYAFAEDANGNLWSWGRNKGFVLWNNKGGTSSQQAQYPNMWDVLSPTQIAGFGTFTTAPPPPANVIPVASIVNIDSTVLSVYGPDTVHVDGSGSYDKDGLIATYTWSVISGPPGAAIGSGATPTGIFPSAGTYVLQLTIVDNSGTSNTTTGYVKVSPRTCPPPVVCPVCPACPPQRSVTAISVTVNGVTYPLPLSWLTITY